MAEEWWSYAERRLCIGNTYFKYRNLHKYTRVARGQNGVDVKIMLYLVLAKGDTLCYMQDVRGIGRGLSDHNVILCKVRLIGT